MYLKPAQPQDLTNILSIYNYAITDTLSLYDIQPKTYSFIENWYDSKVKNNYPVIGAYQEDHELIGFATYGAYRVQEAYACTVEHSFYVDVKYWGKGIGTQLLQHLINTAKNDGKKNLIACIDSTNQSSIHLHHKAGFIKSGTLVQCAFKFNTWLDAHIFQLQLT